MELLAALLVEFTPTIESRGTATIIKKEMLFSHQVKMPQWPKIGIPGLALIQQRMWSFGQRNTQRRALTQVRSKRG